MKRSEAIAMLSLVRDALVPFSERVTLVGSSLVVDSRPVAFVNPSNAVIVHATSDVPAATFLKVGSESTITSLILSRFVAGRGRVAA